MGILNFKLDLKKMSSKYINSLTNRPGKLIFCHNVANYKAKKVTEGIFDFSNIFPSVAIFSLKNGHFWHFLVIWPIFDLKIPTKQKILKISKIPSVTFLWQMWQKISFPGLFVKELMYFEGIFLKSSLKLEFP